ncbi:2-phospho-L-lactate transferase [Herbiconiux sp. L3-i23]|uniref:2-phospho-L-lactate transferase n=1 Tax=Herbiconiux sp. L3-i23 TaxID=2905871 RepID=UPI0020490685|nr:2-phospho-L-lactate transferase [Herbiconiux sp. L3-i23]BDI21842.1 2-phospho-L-lactate transferase [Herbiconiux sp. L3-i23]
MTRIVVLAGGVGGARFLRGVREEARRRFPDGSGGTTAAIAAIVNTGDDAWLAGLRITPDLDSIMYTLAGVNDEQRGWGRLGESERVSAELREYGVGWPWFTLGDLDLGTHIARTSWLRDGLRLSAAVERLTRRWDLGGVRLLPATDDEVETHVRVRDGDVDRELHFQEWWTRYRAALPARAFVQRGVEAAQPAPGVLDAIASADAILLAPSNPVVSIGTVLGIPGLRQAVTGASAPIVGVSPIIGGAVVRGMADACLAAIGVETSAAAVAEHYGRRGRGGLLDGWLVDDRDAESMAAVAASEIAVSSLPLLMRDADTSAAIAAAALDLAGVHR